MGEVAIRLPRPRGANDPQVAVFAADISKMIAAEVEKIAREDADNA
jgi:hypothetical protein